MPTTPKICRAPAAASALPSTVAAAESEAIRGLGWVGE
jgi:hypothetical protein